VRQRAAMASRARAEADKDFDPLASHIFISRRHYRNANDRKAGSAARSTHA
jgi:hypothetical protein